MKKNEVLKSTYFFNGVNTAAVHLVHNLVLNQYRVNTSFKGVPDNPQNTAFTLEAATKLYEQETEYWKTQGFEEER
jgi:hypothetical protein